MGRWVSSIGSNTLPVLVGGILSLMVVASTSCSRLVDNRVRAAQAREADLSGMLGSTSLIAQASLETRRAENLQRLDILQRLEWAFYDLRVRVAAQSGPTSRVGLVYVDERAIDLVSQGDAFPESGERYDLMWPRWPIYGRVLRELRAQGATAVAFDVLFLDRRRSEDALAIPMLEAGRRVTNTIPSDAAFANELSEGAPVVLATLPGAQPVDLFLAGASTIGDVSSPRDSDSVARRVRVVTRMRWLNPEWGVFAFQNGILMDASKAGQVRLIGVGPGGADKVITPDDQGLGLLPEHPRTKKFHPSVGRKIPFYIERDVWHLGIALAATALGLDVDRAERVPGGIRLSGTNGVQRVIPVDESGYMLVDWKLARDGERLGARVDAADLLEANQLREFRGQLAEPKWSNRLAVLGSIAFGNNLADRGATPLDKSDFLVTTHLNVAETLLSGRFLRRPGFGVELILAGCIALFSAVMTWKTRGFLLAVIVVGTGLAWVLVAFWAFRTQQLWLPVAHPIFAGLLVPYVGMVTTRAFVERREQQRVRGVFAKMVSPDIVEEVLRTQDMGMVGAGTRRRVTVFFADVRGFTELTDRVQAAAEAYVREHQLGDEAAERYYEQRASEVLATVNLYLATIADVIKFHRGTLDKYIGDCVMAFWGAPTNNPRHALHAVLSAVDAQWAIQYLNESRERETLQRAAENVERAKRGEPALPPLPILNLGSGLNSGDVTVGLMGSDAHIVNYTVFGREVNLASRLEGASGRARILIGSATFEDLKRDAPLLADACRALEPIAVKGFRDSVLVYEVPWREVRDVVLRYGDLLSRPEAVDTVAGTPGPGAA